MDKLIRVLMENPLLLLILGGWVVGAISNANKSNARSSAKAARRAAKAAKAARREATTLQAPQADAGVLKPIKERRAAPKVGRRQATGPATVGPAARVGQQRGAARSPADVASEMRRVLGLDPTPPSPRPTPPSARPPVPVPVRKPGDRAPIGSVDEGLEIHVDPHVGERIRDRRMKVSKVGAARTDRGAIGNLGGRVPVPRKAESHDRPHLLDDLRKAIIISEILAPPVSMRSPGDRQTI